MISERQFARGFQAFWAELLPLLTSRFISLFTQGYGVIVRDENKDVMDNLPVAPEVLQLDLVAEFAFRLAQYAQEHKISFSQVDHSPDALEAAEEHARKLIEHYEGNPPIEKPKLSVPERTEGIILCKRYSALFSEFGSDAVLDFCPRFPGAGMLASAEGDIGVDDCLIEVKTVKRSTSGNDLRQIITYLALDAAAGLNRWKSFAFFNPRRGTLHVAEIEPFMLRISGGRPATDVFSDLIQFVESNTSPLDTRF